MSISEANLPIAKMFSRLLFFLLSVLATVFATIPPDPGFECSGDQVYDPCPSGRPIYCDDLENPPDCYDDEPCKPRCRCADGQLINNDQKCVPEEYCLKCPGPNEFFSCGIPDDRTCDNLIIRSDIINDVCTERCYCKDGYARDEHDICIPIKECKLPNCKDPNAIYRLCKTCPGTCEKPNSLGCATQACVPGCSCKDGYVHTSSTDNTCVKLSECKCPPNEYFFCGGVCDKSCDNLLASCDDNNNGFCKERCYCIDGYVRNKKNVCIPVEKCIFPKCKDPNAEYLVCKRCIGSCENRDIFCPLSCMPGCSCKEGFIRTSKKNDTCIKESLCKDKRCPGKYQYYTTCREQCPAICPDQHGGRKCAAVVLPCQAGCQCIHGYLTSKIGCVEPKDCPPFVCDERLNEMYSRCGEKCTKTCDSVLGKQPPYCRNEDKCYPECICKKGYVRSRGFRCVPEKKCGSCKDPNEEYSECGTHCERSCQNPNLVCDNTSCKIGCFCRPGYIRNYGKCIPYTDCPAK